MPTYEYRCERCGTFELMQKMSDAALTVCPTCSSPVKRLLSAAPFHLKGSGWYKTDYASSLISSQHKNGLEKNGHEAGEAKSSANGEKADGSTSDNGSSGGSDSTETKKSSSESAAAESTSSSKSSSTDSTA